MKKEKYVSILTVFFAVVMGLTACTSDDDLSEQEQGVVKAEFTISFPQQMSGSVTRQAIDIVQGQADPVFRGLQNIELRPFNSVTVDENTSIPSFIELGTASTEGKGYTLASDILKLTNYTTTFSDNTTLEHKTRSHLYKEISIPIGTRSFLFYGKALDKAVSSGSSYIVNGALEKSQTSTSTTLGGIKFSPVQIFKEETPHSQASEIARYLTNIAKATSGTETTLTYFPNFTQIKAGSWNSVKAAVQEMYSSLYNKTDGLSQAIVAAIKTQTWGETVHEFATGTSESPELNFTATYTYPNNINLPDGAAYVQWSTSANEFQVLTNDNMGLNINTLDKYVYPAALYYYGFSGIKTVNTPMESHYVSSNSWKDILEKYDAVEGVNSLVQSTTRSIAIVNEMQYAVGRLDVTVKSENGSTTLKDNADKEVTFDSDDFPITGIIIGNQRPVGYNFATNASETPYVIYDSQVYDLTGETNSYLCPGDPTTKTHTLVLQTLDAESAADTDPANVPIAVEFRNDSGKSIVGKDNEVIYPNTKFYLIGTLKPYNNTSQKYVGTNTVIKKAFAQDYVTTANFIVKSFKNAYNLLPDLRKPNLEIGMSVDMVWNTGISQDITID